MDNSNAAGSPSTSDDLHSAAPIRHDRDDFSPPSAPMRDDFSPPGPDPFSPPTSPRRRRRSRRADFSPPSASIQAAEGSAPAASSSRINTTLGREVRDNELFNTSSKSFRKPRAKSTLGREVRDNELFTSDLPPPPSRVIGREVRDSELFGATRTIRRPERRGNRGVAGAGPVLGREIRDGELFARREQRVPKPRRPNYHETRAVLESEGVSITSRKASELFGRYETLPWRIGRQHPEAHRLDGGEKRLSELSLEYLRTRLANGNVPGITDLHDDFLFALVAHDAVKPATLETLEMRHPALAPVLEAAWARIAEVEELPEGVDSWRELHDSKMREEKNRLDGVRARVRQSYRESANRSHRRVVSLPSGAQLPPPKRRRAKIDPSYIPPPSLLTRLRNEHRRSRKRR